VQIRYQSDRRIVDVAHPGETILDVSIRYEVPHFRECGGIGRCTTCRVRVLAGIGNMTPRTPAEARIAEARGWDEFTCLACQTRVTGPVRSSAW
jgi:adenylate cyclase